jgi:methylated-DNA-protein-cysteine methyltransferase-like protein
MASGKSSTTRRTAGKSPFARVWDLVRRIPRGRVLTYGAISERLGRRLSARAVGWAMNGCPDDVPWWRVVNAKGTCSTDALAEHPGLQRALLEKERVRFDAAGRLDLERYLWDFRASRSASRKPSPAPRRATRSAKPRP